MLKPKPPPSPSISCSRRASERLKAASSARSRRRCAASEAAGAVAPAARRPGKSLFGILGEWVLGRFYGDLGGFLVILWCFMAVLRWFWWIFILVVLVVSLNNMVSKLSVCRVICVKELTHRKSDGFRKYPHPHQHFVGTPSPSTSSSLFGRQSSTKSMWSARCIGAALSVYTAGWPARCH